MALLRPIALNYRHEVMVSAGRTHTRTSIYMDGSGTLRTTDREFLAPSIFHFAATQNEANHAGIDEKRSQAVGFDRQ